MKILKKEGFKFLFNHGVQKVNNTKNGVQLDVKNKPAYGVKLINAFPTSVTGIELDQMQESAPMELSVTLSYDKLTNLKGPASSTIGGIKAVLDILT